MCTNTLEAKIRRGIEEYEQGKVHKMEEGESVDSFLKGTEQESTSGSKETVKASGRNPQTCISYL